jgi:PAS domain S-box-containing protein
MNEKQRTLPHDALVARSKEIVLLFCAFFAVLIICSLALRAWIGFRSASLLADQAQATRVATDTLLSSLKDAETGQRGYLLTGKSAYLEPFNQAVAVLPKLLDNCRRLAVMQNDDQVQRVQKIQTLAKLKLLGLSETIELRRTRGIDAALAVVQTDRGKHAMDQMRRLCQQIDDADDSLRARYSEESRSDAHQLQIVATGGSAFLFFMLSAATVSNRRATANRLTLLQEARNTERAALQARDQHRQAEEKNALLASIIMFSQDAIISKTLDGTITSWNPGAEHLLGYTASEAVGAHVSLIVPADRMEEESHIIGQLRQGHTVQQFETIRLRKDGRPLHVSLTASPLRDSQGQVIGAIKSLHDMTRSKLEAAKFRALLEAAPDAMVVVEPKGTIGLVNARVEKLFGYQRDELLGKPVEILIPQGFPSQHPGLSADSLLPTQPQRREAALELIARRKDGTEFPVEISLARLDTEEGTLTSAAIRDVSERKRVEQQIIELNQQFREKAAEAEVANRAKSVFLSTMSHEIRTPMNAILGYTQLLLRDPKLEGPARANLEIIGRSGEHLLTLLNDILDVSKIEAGRAEVRLTTFHLPRLLDDLAALFLLRAESKALRFEMLTDATKVYLSADEGKLRQAMVNLVGNAVKFTVRGHIKVRVNLQTRSDNRVWLTAQVEDTGPGMTLAEQQMLFQPFSQTERGLNTTGGSGLGLFISRNYARLMGGDISVSSKPGEGSIFQLEIPVELSGSGGYKPAVTRRVRHLSAGTPTTNILVVDDLFENRDWLIKLLSAVGFSVFDGDNGATAIRIWEQSKPDLILMDVHMPVMDGLEATRRIKATPLGQQTPIVVISASALDQDRARIEKSGADDFIMKPCLEDRLLETIAAHLKVSYEYEEIAEAESFVDRDTNRDLDQIPQNLVAELEDAVSDGNTDLMNRLITEVRNSEASASAAALQELVDNYDYDSLLALLAKVSHRE